jgi:chromate transporter
LNSAAEQTQPHSELFCSSKLRGVCNNPPTKAGVGYFREEFVVRRRWLSEQTFVDLVALCQFLPARRRAKPDLRSD